VKYISSIVSLILLCITSALSFNFGAHAQNPSNSQCAPVKIGVRGRAAKSPVIIDQKVPCSEGQAEGAGVVTWRLEDDQIVCSLSGNFVGGTLTGKGREECPNIFNYEGDFVGGIANGTGTRIYLKSGEIRHGIFRNNIFYSGWLAGPKAAKDAQGNAGQGMDAQGRILSFQVFTNGEWAADCRPDGNIVLEANCTATLRNTVVKNAIEVLGKQKISDLATQPLVNTSSVRTSTNSQVDPINCLSFPFSRSANIPNEMSGKQAACITVAKNLGTHNFRFVSFTKTDGQSANMFGVQGYTMFYVAEIEYTSDLRSECANPSRFLEPQCVSELSVGGNSIRGNRLPRAAKAGARVKRTGKIMFERYESGWKWLSVSGVD
jgi:hypothetical protein